MKKILLLAFMVMFIGIIAPCKVYAVDISVGATTWYTWWEIETHDGDKFNFDPGFMYGPTMSVEFNDDFNLTFLYLYGKFDLNYSPFPVTFKRRDLDIALNYRLNGFFKLFGGIKYMSYTYSIADWVDFDHSCIGPGLGLSASFPMSENLFILANISYMYLWGDQEDGTDKISFKGYGINSSVLIAYYIVPASTVISLGGRSQYYVTDYDNSDVIGKYKFYGITLTATYNFSI